MCRMERKDVDYNIRRWIPSTNFEYCDRSEEKRKRGIERDFFLVSKYKMHYMSWF